MNEQKPTRRSKAKFEMYLGNYMTFWSYLQTYHYAFNVLVDDAERTNSHIDKIAYPILFIARHCLELGFKANIRCFKKYSEKTAFTNSDSHNLKDLLGGFKLHINATVNNLKNKYGIVVEPWVLKEFESYCNEVEKLTHQLNIIDKGFFSFRYPVDKDNKNVFKYDCKINLLDIKEAFDKLMTLFYYALEFFSKYTDYADMIESTYKEEMLSVYENY